MNAYQLSFVIIVIVITVFLCFISDKYKKEKIIVAYLYYTENGDYVKGNSTQIGSVNFYNKAQIKGCIKRGLCYSSQYTPYLIVKTKSNSYEFNLRHKSNNLINDFINKFR